MSKKLLLNYSEKLTERDSKTHRKLKFETQEDFDRLVVLYSYAEKKLEDEAENELLIKRALNDLKIYDIDTKKYGKLNNLVTISLDDAKIFRGGSHRHDNEQKIVIGKDCATEGYVSGEVTRGEWTLWLHVHCVVTKECHVKISVYGEKSDDTSKM